MFWRCWLYDSPCCKFACGSWCLSVHLHMTYLNNHMIWYYDIYLCASILLQSQSTIHCTADSTCIHTYTHRESLKCMHARARTHTQTTLPNTSSLHALPMHHYCMLSFHSPYPAVQSQSLALPFLLSTSPAHLPPPLTLRHTTLLTFILNLIQLRPGASVAERSAARDRCLQVRRLAQDSWQVCS